MVRSFDIRRIENAAERRVIDDVAIEEPLEIRLEYWVKKARRCESLVVTMRTPGHDRELVAGFLLSEGIIRESAHIKQIREIGPSPSNEIVAELAPEVDVEAWRLARNGFVLASCGICGKRTREALAVEVPQLAPEEFRVSATVIESVPALLAARQLEFSRTGGLHAAGLVNAAGEMEALFEDIGRHNALDKLIGYSVLNDRIPLRSSLLCLSSRSSFELIQKTAMAGAPILVTIGGSSSLAIESAREYGITLIGFVRGQRFNIYSGEWRIESSGRLPAGLRK